MPKHIDVLLIHYSKIGMLVFHVLRGEDIIKLHMNEVVTAGAIIKQINFIYKEIKSYL